MTGTQQRPDTNAGALGDLWADHGQRNRHGRQRHQEPAARRDADKWRPAVASLSEVDRARYDQPRVYADLHSPPGGTP